MTTDLVPIASSSLPAPAGDRDLLEDFLSTLSKRTLRAYSFDLAHFGRWLDLEPRQAVSQFLALDAGEANRIAIAWKAAMSAAGLAPATIARRLASLRSVVTYANTVGRVIWSLRVKSPKVRALSRRARAG